MISIGYKVLAMIGAIWDKGQSASKWLKAEIDIYRKNQKMSDDTKKTLQNPVLTTQKGREAAALALRTALEDGGNHIASLFTNPVEIKVTNHQSPKEAENGEMVEKSLSLIEKKGGLDPRNGYAVDLLLTMQSEALGIPAGKYARMNTTENRNTVPVVMLGKKFKNPYIHFLPLDGGVSGGKLDQKVSDKFDKYRVKADN